jgi:hypothetical protein
VVLLDVGPHPEVVVDRLVTLGCPPDAARWFIHSCTVGGTPDIVMEPTLEEATDLVADLADLGATAKILGGEPAPLFRPPSPSLPSNTPSSVTPPSITPPSVTRPSISPDAIATPADLVNGAPVAAGLSDGYERRDGDLAGIVGIPTNGHHFELPGDAEAPSLAIPSLPEAPPTTPSLPEAPPVPLTNGHAGPSPWTPPAPQVVLPEVPLPPVPTPPVPASSSNPVPRVITMPPWPAHLPPASSSEEPPVPDPDATTSAVAAPGDTVAVPSAATAPASIPSDDVPPAEDAPVVPRTRPLYSMFTPETTRVAPPSQPAVEEAGHTSTPEEPVSAETPAAGPHTTGTAEPPTPALTPVRALAPVDVVHELAAAYRAGDAMSVADCFRPDAVIYIGRDRVVATGRDEIQEYYERLFGASRPTSAGLLARIVSGPWVIDHEGADSLSCYRVDGGYITELLMLEPGTPPI